MNLSLLEHFIYACGLSELMKGIRIEKMTYGDFLILFEHLLGHSVLISHLSLPFKLPNIILSDLTKDTI